LVALLITLCTNVKAFPSFQVDKKQLQFPADHNNSANNVSSIEYAKKLIK